MSALSSAVLNEPAMPAWLWSVYFSYPQGVEVMRLRSIGVLLLGLILASFSPANAQERFGGLSGTVTDPSDAPVPGATVTATNKTSGRGRTAVTEPMAVYRILDLDPGDIRSSRNCQDSRRPRTRTFWFCLAATSSFRRSCRSARSRKSSTSPARRRRSTRRARRSRTTSRPRSSTGCRRRAASRASR